MIPQPLTDYTGYEHVLGGQITFVHPVTGNVYATACEKHDGIHQDLSIYRMRSGVLPPKWELVKRYRGGIDAVGQFTMGSAMINTYGALMVSYSCVPLNDATRTKTGFQAMWDWIPVNNNDPVDEPWGDDRGALAGRVAALKQQVAGLETALGNVIAGEALPARYVTALEGLCKLMGI